MLHVVTPKICYFIPGATHFGIARWLRACPGAAGTHFDIPAWNPSELQRTERGSAYMCRSHVAQTVTFMRYVRCFFNASKLCLRHQYTCDVTPIICYFIPGPADFGTARWLRAWPGVAGTHFNIPIWNPSEVQSNERGWACMCRSRVAQTVTFMRYIRCFFNAPKL